LTPQITTLLQDMLEVYHQARTYRDEGRLTILQANGRVRNITKMPSSIQFRRPDRLQVTSGQQTISCDGQELQIVLDTLRQYQQAPAPAKLTMDQLRIGAPGAGLDEGFPEILEFLLGEAVFDRWLDAVTRIELRPQQEPLTIEGEPCHVIAYETRHKAKLTLYIAKESLLLWRCDMDYTEAQRPAGAPRPENGQTLPSLQYAYQLHPVRVNEPIPDSLFVPRKLSGMRLVKEFTPPGPSGGGADWDDPAPQPPLGPGHGSATSTQLPEFKAADLEGRTVDRSTLAGKVALLFLWTPKGSGESLASIQMVQRVANEFVDRQDFCPLGITLATEDTSLIKGLLTAKKASFRSVLDTEGTLMAALQVSVLPTFCLVSRTGTITEVFAGVPEGGENTLKQKIESLLNQ